MKNYTHSRGDWTRRASLTKPLLELGYRVAGSSSDAQSCDSQRLKRPGARSDVEIISITPNEPHPHTHTPGSGAFCQIRRTVEWMLCPKPPKLTCTQKGEHPFRVIFAEPAGGRSSRSAFRGPACGACSRTAAKCMRLQPFEPIHGK